MTDKDILRLCAIRCHERSLSHFRDMVGADWCDEDIKILQDIAYHVSIRGARASNLTDSEIKEYLFLKKSHACDFKELKGERK